MDDYTSTPDRSVREQLNTLFTRYDFVGIKNPLDEEFKWPVALEQNEIVSVNPGDPMNEERMAQRSGGTFLPGDSTVRQQGKQVIVTLKAGERRMVIGEAAYVVVPRIFNALVRSKYGTTKAGLARLRNPATQRELLKEIVVGPVINNVEGAMQTYVNEKLKDSVEGFSDVQVDPPKAKGFSNPEVLAKAQATRNANKAARTQTA